MILRITSRLDPITRTSPTKLIPTPRTSHMIAALILLNPRRTLRTRFSCLLDALLRRRLGRRMLAARHPIVVLGTRLVVVPGRFVLHALPEAAGAAGEDGVAG